MSPVRHSSEFLQLLLKYVWLFPFLQDALSRVNAKPVARVGWRDLHTCGCLCSCVPIMGGLERGSLNLCSAFSLRHFIGIISQDPDHAWLCRRWFLQSEGYFSALESGCEEQHLAAREWSSTSMLRASSLLSLPSGLPLQGFPGAFLTCDLGVDRRQRPVW